jgi:hypothetical protein
MDVEEFIAGAEGKGIVLTDVQKKALRIVSPGAKMMKSALELYEVSAIPFDTLVSEAVSIASKKGPLSEGGGENDMTQNEGLDEPMPMTFEELEALIPEETKQATEFEKSPVWAPQVNEAIVARLKRVHKGAYEQPLVIASEFAAYNDGKLGGIVRMKTDSPSGEEEVTEIDGPSGEIQQADLRIPTFAVSRAMDKGVKLVEDYVYFFKLVGEKETRFANTYKQVLVIALGDRFPKPKEQ